MVNIKIYLFICSTIFVWSVKGKIDGDLLEGEKFKNSEDNAAKSEEKKMKIKSTSNFNKETHRAHSSSSDEKQVFADKSLTAIRGKSEHHHVGKVGEFKTESRDVIMETEEVDEKKANVLPNVKESEDVSHEKTEGKTTFQTGESSDGEPSGKINKLELKDDIRYKHDSESKPSEDIQDTDKEHADDGMYEREKKELKEMISHELGFDSEIDVSLSSKSFKSEHSDESESIADAMTSTNRDPLRPPLTEEDIEAEKLFNEGFKKVNSSNHFQTISDGYQLLLEASARGHGRASVEVAFSQLQGRFLTMDIEAAKKTFELQADKGSPQAQAGLAFLYGTGIHSNSSQAKALIYLTFSALGGDTMGRMMLAYRYWAGIGVSQNCESSLSYYRKVANEVASRVTMSGGVMIHRIRILDEVESSGGSSGRVDDDLVQYYQFLADKGDVQAQVGLGQLYYQGGRGFEQDIGRAFEYFTLAANSKNANAQAYLGKMYAEGSEYVKQDNVTALKYFQKAAEQGNPVGQAGLGTMYLHGKGIKMDYKQAVKYFQMSADQGWVEGQLQLGNMYFLGLGVKRDYKQAARYFNLASQSGHLLAVYNLAQMHASGTGVPRSCHMAVELYKNVCERGRWSTWFDAAYHQYQVGKVDSALVIYLMLAELGYEVGQSNVAHILDQKESKLLLNESFPRALVYWNRAASQGYTAARIKLGDYHYYGHGTEVDFETAAVHYKLASEQSNNAQAMFNLGYMHEQGLGLKKDFHLAKRFYDLAAEASPDAQAPVMLALMKVGLLYAVEYIKKQQWTLMVHGTGINDYISDDWDIYVMTVLALILGFIVAFRRQHVNRIQAQDQR